MGFTQMISLVVVRILSRPVAGRGHTPSEQGVQGRSKRLNVRNKFGNLSLQETSIKDEFKAS